MLILPHPCRNVPGWKLELEELLPNDNYYTYTG